MITAIAEEGLYSCQFTLERQRDATVAPTDFRVIHQVLTSLRGILEPERFSLRLCRYEVIDTGDRRQFLALDDDEEIAFTLANFLAEDVEAWETRLLAEHKFAQSLEGIRSVKVRMADYDQVLFYSRQTRTMGLTETLSDRQGQYLYETSGGQEVLWFLLFMVDPLGESNMQIDLGTRTTLIFENKRLVDRLIAAVEDLKVFGWKVVRSPSDLIPVDRQDKV
jgi:hypothetical protein